MEGRADEEGNGKGSVHTPANLRNNHCVIVVISSVSYRAVHGLGRMVDQRVRLGCVGDF